MYLHKTKKSNGDIYLTIREKYYVPKKGSRERIVECPGCVSLLKEKYDDPIAFFTQRAKELTEQKKVEKSASINIDCTEKMSIETNDIKNGSITNFVG